MEVELITIKKKVVYNRGIIIKINAFQKVYNITDPLFSKFVLFISLHHIHFFDEIAKSVKRIIKDYKLKLINFNELFKLAKIHKIVLNSFIDNCNNNIDYTDVSIIYFSYIIKYSLYNLLLEKKIELFNETEKDIVFFFNTLLDTYVISMRLNKYLLPLQLPRKNTFWYYLTSCFPKCFPKLLL